MTPRRKALVSLSKKMPFVPGVAMSGTCSARECEPEAACHNFPNKTYTCICPHDSSTPTEDLKCPNRRTVPLTPRPIPNIIPPTGFITNNVTTEKTTEPDLGGSSVMSGAFPVFFPVVLIMTAILFAFAGFLCWRKHKYPSDSSLKCKTSSGPITSETPVCLSKGPLGPGRYSTNPQYMTATGEATHPLLSVPTLKKDDLIFNDVIGEGCFGKVFKGGLTLEGVEVTVAIKELKESATKEVEEDFMREVEIVSSFQHFNILTLIGVILKENNRGPWMVFEFMPFGDLTEVLRSNSQHLKTLNSAHPKLTKSDLVSISTQIASGMQYLAAQHFVHRDLACRNCLVGEKLVVKIADFGMSRDVYTCDYYRIGGARMLPVRWMSPESITFGRFTLESDVWSFGVVLWEIYTFGMQPYYGHSNEEVIKLVVQGLILNPPSHTPPSIYDLMKSCWKKEPRERPNFNEICSTLSRLPTSQQLPRPPPFTVHPVLTDNEDYLLPRQPNSPHDYLEPLPD